MLASYVSLAVFAMGATAIPNMPSANGNPFEGSFPFMPSGSSSVEDDDGMSNPVPAYMAAMQAVEQAQAGTYNNPTPIQQAAPSLMPFQPATPVAEPALEPAAQALEEKPQPATQQEMAQPAAPKPESDDKQEFDAPMSQPSAPALNNPIPPIPEYAVPSSMSSVIAHVKPSPAFSAVYEYSSSMSIMVSVPVSTSMAPIVVEAAPSSESMPMEMAPVTILPTPAQSIVQTAMAKPSSFTTRPIVKTPTPTYVAVASHSANIHAQHLASMYASSSIVHASQSSSATPSPSAHVADEAANMLSTIPVLGPLLSSLGGVGGIL